MFLQQREAGDTRGLQRDDLAIENGAANRQAGGGIGDRWEPLRPVEAGAGAHPCVAVLDPALCPVAVELDLVHPVFWPAGGLSTRVASSGGMNSGSSDTGAPSEARSKGQVGGLRASVEPVCFGTSDGETSPSLVQTRSAALAISAIVRWLTTLRASLSSTSRSPSSGRAHSSLDLIISQFL